MTSNISDSKKSLNPLLKDDLNILLNIKKLFISRIDQSMNNVISDFIENESMFYSNFGALNIKYIEEFLEVIEEECLHLLNSTLFSSFEVVYSNLLKSYESKE